MKERGYDQTRWTSAGKNANRSRRTQRRVVEEEIVWAPFRSCFVGEDVLLSC